MNFCEMRIADVTTANTWSVAARKVIFTERFSGQLSEPVAVAARHVFGMYVQITR